MLNIHKEIYGQGEPLVLIHGWAMHSGIWRTFAQQLSVYYKVICLDLPGHGLSETITPYTLDKISEALIDVIQDTSFSLLGWSLGATIALNMTQRYPQRINSLTMVAGNPKFVRCYDWPGMQDDVLNAFAAELRHNCRATLLRFLGLQVKNLPTRKKILQQLKTAIEERESPHEQVLQGGLTLLLDVDLRNYLSQITCPIQIIQGDKDTLVPVQASVEMKKIQPNAETNIIAGAGHVPFLSHPARMIELLCDFV